MKLASFLIAWLLSASAFADVAIPYTRTEQTALKSSIANANLLKPGITALPTCTYWTNNSVASYVAFTQAIVMGSTAATMTCAWVMPFAGSIVGLSVFQNGGTTAAGTIYIGQTVSATAQTSIFPVTSTPITATNFIQVSSAAARYTTTFPNGTYTFGAGDVLLPGMAYAATGVNQSNSITLYVEMTPPN